VIGRVPLGTWRTVTFNFKTKPEIALEQIRWACEGGLPRGTVLLDTSYGHDSKLRRGITELGLPYVAGIQSQTLVWAPSTRPRHAPKKGRRDEPNAISVKEVALGLRAKAWRTIKWREGANEWLSSRFARVCICVASSHERPEKPLKEWLLIEWPEGEDEPAKYWLSTLPKNIPFRDLVDAAKLRWRIERDYQELKQEVGLGHFEGRGWRGFHHHATLCIAAYGFGRRFPLKTMFHRAAPATCRTRQLPTQRIRHCGLSGTSRTRSRPCTEG
jgi:SRSO17 transposase